MKNWQIFARKSIARGRLDLEYLDETSNRKVQAHRYVALLQNPYASLSVFDKEGEEMTAAPLQIELPIGSTSSVNTKPSAGIIKSAFAKGCREILRQYEPLNTGTTRLRPQFVDFIKQNQTKSPETRAAILEQLSRYNLGGSTSAFELRAGSRSNG